MTLTATVDLFERHGFKVKLRNNDTHMIMDHKSGRLQIAHWPTSDTWMAWGRVWKGSTPEQVIEAFNVGRFSMPREIHQTATGCKNCHATIWWAKTNKGKKMPVNADGARHAAPICKLTKDTEDMTSRGIQNMSWSCHICHDTRPDDKISVKTTDVSEDYNLDHGTMKQNVRYCNDRSACMEAALTFRFYKVHS